MVHSVSVRLQVECGVTRKEARYELLTQFCGRCGPNLQSASCSFCTCQFSHLQHMWGIVFLLNVFIFYWNYFPKIHSLYQSDLSWPLWSTHTHTQTHTLTFLFKNICNANLKGFDTAPFTRFLLMLLYRKSSLSGKHSCFVFGGLGFQSRPWDR